MFVTAAASVAAGVFKGEIVLLLSAGIILSVAFYAFIAVFTLSLIHKKRAASLNAIITVPVLACGESSALKIQTPLRFFQAPACMVRYEVNLQTQNGRSFVALFPPEFFAGKICEFACEKRGAYYGQKDAIVIFDCFGFWRKRLDVLQDKNIRLCVTPYAIANPPKPVNFAAGNVLRKEKSIVQSNDLNESRPYIPGDDPRRINWKLYGHASELFVRVPELETPPHSLITMVVDASVDANLFSQKDAANAVDLLCAAALGIAAESVKSGMEIQIFYSAPPDFKSFSTEDNLLNNKIFKDNDNPLSACAAILSFPVAVLLENAVLPPISASRAAFGDCGKTTANSGPVLYLALPRRLEINPGVTLTSALDRFITGREKTVSASQEEKALEIMFVYPAKMRKNNFLYEKTAYINALHYGKINNVYAKSVCI